MAAEPTSPRDGDDDGLVAVGAVGAAVGIRGEVTIVSWTDDPELRFAPGSVLSTEPADVGPFTVAASRFQGAKLVVRFDGVDDRNTAEALRRTQLFVPQAARPPLQDPDDFYDTDLVGLTAVDPAGGPLGTVTAVEHGAGGDRLVVTSDGRDHLVPFVSVIVPRVDLAAGRVVVDAPEGLWEL
ncbi:ribosome maturation factor RimM [Jatrophihabitans sp. YIM 134969]